MIPVLEIEGVPHWRSRFPQEIWPAFEDFRNFLCLAWDYLQLPEPTRAQLEIAHRLQYGADSYEWDTLTEEQKNSLTIDPREDVIRAFRAVGKSYTTSAFAIWRLMRNPRGEKILVVSATGSKAKEFVDMTKALLMGMPLCQWLLMGPTEGGTRRRDMADRFDVSGASISQSHSVKAVGIEGQLAGSRATLIIADDIEIPRNSKTEDGRENILNAIRSDFGPIRKTEYGRGDMIFLGTPQTEESVYNVLVAEMGYSCFCIPARFPSADKMDNYNIRHKATDRPIPVLAPYLRALHDNGRLPHGAPTDERFGDGELFHLESQGRAHFALQYMLDTSLSDAERYPLKQYDLLVMAANFKKAPLVCQWGMDSDRKNLITDIHNLGFSGDRLMRPLFVDKEWREYEGLVLFVDPAGRGADETAWAILGHLGGMFFLLKVGGHSGDPAEAMVRIAHDAKMYNVNVVEVEPNYAQGIWVNAFQPVLSRVWPGGCSVIESEWSQGQKEERIIGVLEPVMTAHRLVVSEEVIREDVERARAKDENERYSFIYQMTHITHERQALKHDDRLEAVGGAVAHFYRALAIDVDKTKEETLGMEKDAMIEEFIEDWEEGFLFGGRYKRGKRRKDGYRAEVWSSN